MATLVAGYAIRPVTEDDHAAVLRLVNDDRLPGQPDTTPLTRPLPVDDGFGEHSIELVRMTAPGQNLPRHHHDSGLSSLDLLTTHLGQGNEIQHAP